MVVRLYRIIEYCHVVFTGNNPTGEYVCCSVHGTLLFHKFHEINSSLQKYVLKLN